MIHLSPPGRHRVTQPERKSRQPQLRYLAAVGLASLLVLAVASPAHAKPVQPRSGEGFIAMTQRTCGSSAGWQQNQARAGTAWAYLGRTYDIQCGAQRADTRASRSTPARAGSWVYPLATRLGCSARDFGIHTLSIEGYARMHYGQDMRASHGTVIRSMGAGQIVRAGWRGGYGNAIEIRHADGTTAMYAHASSLLRRSGTVAAGEAIAKVGSTGLSTGAHLHLGVTRDGAWVDPRGITSAHGLRLC